MEAIGVAFSFKNIKKYHIKFDFKLNNIFTEKGFLNENTFAWEMFVDLLE